MQPTHHIKPITTLLLTTSTIFVALMVYHNSPRILIPISAFFSLLLGQTYFLNLGSPVARFAITVTLPIYCLLLINNYAHANHTSLKIAHIALAPTYLIATALLYTRSANHFFNQNHNHTQNDPPIRERTQPHHKPLRNQFANILLIAAATLFCFGLYAFKSNEYAQPYFTESNVHIPLYALALSVDALILGLIIKHHTYKQKKQNFPTS